MIKGFPFQKQEALVMPQLILFEAFEVLVLAYNVGIVIGATLWYGSASIVC